MTTELDISAMQEAVRTRYPEVAQIAAGRFGFSAGRKAPMR